MFCASSLNSPTERPNNIFGAEIAMSSDALWRSPHPFPEGQAHSRNAQHSEKPPNGLCFEPKLTNRADTHRDIDTTIQNSLPVMCSENRP